MYTGSQREYESMQQSNRMSVYTTVNANAVQSGERLSQFSKLCDHSVNEPIIH